jgi:dephospho-CoA kinase
MSHLPATRCSGTNEGGTGLVIGVTGLSGSGQSTVAALLGRAGAQVCSLDRVGHRLLEKRTVKEMVSRAFGDPAIASMPAVAIRKRLAGSVFSDPAAMALLTSILHPRMSRWISLSAAGLAGREEATVIEGALLLELGARPFLDHLVVVAAPCDTCMERIVSRDGLPEGTARARLTLQEPLTANLMKADWVILNGPGTTEAALAEQTARIHELILRGRI